MNFVSEETWIESGSEGHEISGDNIKLNEKEESIFALLLDVLQENGLKTTLRVAGGWVRDKLYGKESNDIDIALDDLLGSEFAPLIQKKLEEIDAKEGKKDGKKS